MFSQACVKNSVHRGEGVSAKGGGWTVCPEGCLPGGSACGGGGVGQTPQPLRDMVNKRLVCILLECILVLRMYQKTILPGNAEIEFLLLITATR